MKTDIPGMEYLGDSLTITDWSAYLTWALQDARRVRELELLERYGEYIDATKTKGEDGDELSAGR